MSGEPEQLHCAAGGAGADGVTRLRRRLVMHIKLQDKVFSVVGRERALCVGHREPIGDSAKASREGGRRVEATGNRKENGFIDGFGFQLRWKLFAAEIHPGDVESVDEPGH